MFQTKQLSDFFGNEIIYMQALVKYWFIIFVGLTAK